jgi:cellulose 1,4-beta-cellobiosidase
VSQGTGTISQSGLYPAPQVAETDVVTVTSQADTTKSASATVSVAAPHSVTLGWSPSTTTGVTYNVYRGTLSGGPYSLLSSGLSSTSYTDTSVQSGSTYYYVTTAVDSAGESPYSNAAQAVIPMP